MIHQFMPDNVKRLNRTRLSLSICMLMQMTTTAYALETISDEAMRSVSGQDGIAITAEMDEASIDKITWQDGQQGSLVFNDTKITNPTGQAVKTDITLQTGASNNAEATPGLSATVSLSPADIQVPNLSVCDKDGASCSKLGALAVTNSGTQTQFSLVTTNGLFNERGTAKLKAVIDDLTVAIKQDNGSQTNQLMLGDMYANMTADGKLFVTDTQGLKFIGTVTFDKSTLSGAEREGLEVLVQHQAGSNTSQTLGKIALTGKMTDLDLSVRGVTGTVTDLGFDNGSNGVAMRLSSNFDKDLKVKLGDEAGIGLTGWKNIAGAKSFDTGSVYVNVMPDAATTTQSLSANPRLTASADQISAAQASFTTGRTFQKEVGDTSTTTPFGTTGNQYILQDGFVADVGGNKLKVFNGLKSDKNNGVVDKNFNHVSVKTDIKDGFVAEGPNLTFNQSGSDGQFQNVYRVDSAGNTSLYVLDYVKDRRFGTTSLFPNSYKRYNRQVRVWVQPPNGNLPTNVVVASYGDDQDSYHKAVHLGDTQVDNNNYRYLSTSGGGDNLSNLDNPYTVNKYGEVLDRNGDVLLTRHKFNESGFLTDNSDNYVYEHTIKGYVYSINEETKQLEVRKQSDNSLVKTYQLRTFDVKDLSLTSSGDYTITTETVSGDGGVTQSKQNISVNVRDMSLQTYATETEFFDNETNKTDTQSWAIAPVLYNTDANVLLFPKTLNVNNAAAGYTQAGEAVGYKLAVTTKGSNGASDFNQADATRTTGLLVTHEDTTNVGKTRYLGVRHMDSLIKAQGDIQITGDGIAITANELLFAFRAELAAGTMPTTGETFKTSDRLAVLEGRLKGSLQAKVTPETEGVGFDATLKLAQGNYGTNSGVRVMMPDGNASINMGEITGTLRAKGTIDTVNTSSDPSNTLDGAVQIKSTLTMNPSNNAAEDLRIRNVGFNTKPISTGFFSPYRDVRLGQVGFSQNTIYSEVTISK